MSRLLRLILYDPETQCRRLVMTPIIVKDVGKVHPHARAVRGMLISKKLYV